jgi:hypothetical protein
MKDGSSAVVVACENVTGVLVAYSWLLENEIATVKQLLDHPKSQLLEKLQLVIESHQDSVLYSIQDSTVATSSSSRRKLRIFRCFVNAVLYFVQVLAEHDIPPIGNDYLSKQPLKNFITSTLFGHLFKQSLFIKANEVEDIVDHHYMSKMKGSYNVAAKILSISQDKKYKRSLEALSKATGSTLCNSGTLQTLLSTKGWLILQMNLM